MAGQIHVYGAGAVGTLVAGFLLKDGENVVLIDPRDGLRAPFAEKGLRVDGVRRVWADVEVLSPADVTGPLEQVILACPADALDQTLNDIEPLLTPDSVVLTLQPGFSHRHVAERIGAQRVIVGHTSFVARQEDDGLVRYLEPGEFVLGRLDGSTDADLVGFVTRFSRIMDTTLTTNIAGYAWTSSCLNAVNLVLAQSDLPPRQAVADATVRRQIRSVISEAIGNADPVPFDHFDPAGLLTDDAQMTELGLRVVATPPDAGWLVRELVDTLHAAAIPCPQLQQLAAR